MSGQAKPSVAPVKLSDQQHPKTRSGSQEVSEGLVDSVVRLSDVQQRVLAKLVSGRSFRSVARDAGVSRTTIHKWFSQDVEFQAAYNAWRLELEESARARIAGLTDAAVNVVRRALARDNSAVALAVLKGQNLLSPSSIGSSDPEELRRRADIAEVDRDTALWEARAQIGQRRHGIRSIHADAYKSAFRQLEAARDAAGQPDSEEPEK